MKKIQQKLKPFAGVLKIAALCLLLLAIVVTSYFINREVNQYDAYRINDILAEEEDKTPLERKPIIPTQFGLDEGIGSTNILIYASGTKYNDEYIYQSILSAQKVGSTKDVRVIALYDRPSDVGQNDFLETRMYYINKEDKQLISSDLIEKLGRANMGSSQTLYDFLYFAMSNFPARKNVLVVDGVGKGNSGILFDESANDYLTEKELQQAISQVRFSSGTVLDLLILHSSFTASLEITSGLAEFVKYTIASPDYVRLQPLDYYAIVQAANESSNQDSRYLTSEVYKSAFGGSNCVADNTFVAYDMQKTLNIVNALETMSSAYFQEGSTTTMQEEFTRAHALSTRLYEPQDSLPVLSFDSWVSQIFSSKNPEIKSAGSRLSQDLASAVLYTCRGISPVLVFNLPDSDNSKLDNQFVDVSYERLKTFREVVRRLKDYNPNLHGKYENVEVEDAMLKIEPQSDQMFCVAGYRQKDKFVLISQMAGFIQDGAFKCLNSNFGAADVHTGIPLIRRTKGLSYETVQINYDDNYLLGNLAIESKNGKLSRLEVTSSSISDFAFIIPTKDFQYRGVLKSYDKDGNLGFAYSEVSKSTDISFTNGPEIDYAIASKENHFLGEVIKVGKAQNKALELNQTNKLFNLNSSLNAIPQREYQLRKDLDMTRAEHRRNVYDKSRFYKVAVPNDFLYYSFIRTGNLFETNQHGVDYGADKLYYRGGFLSEVDNIAFWDQWYGTREATKNIKR